MEFLRYPHVIPHFCNSGGFGPRWGVTPTSPCTWVDHLVSGRIPATQTRAIHTRFRSGSTTLAWLNLATEIHSPDHSTKGTPLGRPEGHRPLTVCGYMGSGLFHSPYRGAFHLSLTVLVPYRSSRIFSLGGWSPLLPTGFLVSRGTQALGGSQRAFRYGTFTRCGGAFTPLRVAAGWSLPYAGPTTPLEVAPYRFRLLRVRSPLLAESRLISFPQGTEMFQFPWFPSAPLWIQGGIRGYGPRGLPHSDSHGSSLARSSPCTFRRDPRPSSVRDA